MEFNNVFQILNVDFSEFRKIYSNLSKLSDEEISSHLKNINCFESRTTFESLYNVDFKGDQIDIKCSNTLIIHVYYPNIIKTFEPYIINAIPSNDFNTNGPRNSKFSKNLFNNKSNLFIFKPFS